MRTSLKRVIRSLLAGAVLIPTLAACAAVGGGGTVETDCETDVSGSELTPIATGDYGGSGASCNNNEFVDTDLDAFAYGVSGEADHIFARCEQSGGSGASFTLFEIVNGTPTERLSAPCDDSIYDADHSEGDRYVFVVDHPASSVEAHFRVYLDNN